MARTPKDSSTPGGFTLYELVAVMVLTAILVGTVAITVRGPIANARLEASLDRLETMDARTRAEAIQREQSVALVFDSSERLVFERSASDADASPGRSFALPRGVEIAQVKTPSHAAEHGGLQIVVSPLGQSDTYALQLQASGGRARWFVVLGASGQCLRFDAEDHVEDIFSLQRGAIGVDAR